MPCHSKTAPISLPEGTIEGRLSNGLHYLILRNSVPVSRVEFRLIMRVGSLQETEEEKGCAHFLEHLAFGGTKHFPGRSLVNYVESLGMKYGTDINAFTGYDRTIYMFAVPTDHVQASVIDSSLLIVRDWLDGISFLPEKVEAEKGIILEELRSYDVNDEFYHLKIGQGLFSRRLPLGTADDIRRVTPQVLRGYYDKWYVPALATLVVVGDVSPEEVEKKIKKRFSSLKECAGEGFCLYPLEYEKGIRLSEVKDSLQKQTRVELMIPHPCVIERTIKDAVTKENGRLLVRAIGQRFGGRGIKADVSDSWYLSDKNHFVLSVESEDRQKLLDTITAAVGELHCLIREGWKEEELADVRTSFCGQLPEGGDGEWRSSASFCDDFVDYVISGDRYMTTSADWKRLKDAMLQTDSEDLQQLLKEWMSYWEESLLVACHSHDGLGAPLTEQEILMAWRKGMRSECTPYIYTRNKRHEDAPSETPACLAVRPAFSPTDIASRRIYEKTGIWDVKLKNGIRLVMKSTQDADSTLYMTSFAPFGISSLSDEEYPLLEGIAGYMDMGGIAKVDWQVLSDYLFQKNISLTMAVENHWHGFMGMSPSANAGEFFNLIYEKIVDPELKYDDFEELRRDMKKNEGQETTLEKMLKRDSARQLTARMNRLMGAAMPRPSASNVAERLNLDSIAAFYKRLYARPEGSVYVLCGRFNPDEVLRKFVAVFGRIPVSKTDAAYAYPDFKLPERTLVERFPNDDETQTVFDYLFHGYYQPCLKNTLLLKLMRDIIRNRLISVIRERESLVYSPYISLFYEGIPYATFYFDISASADNKNMGRIERLLKEILGDLKRTEVGEEELLSVKRSFLLAKRETLDDTKPAAWRTTLTGLLKNGETLADFEQYEKCLNDITPAELRKAFGEWIDIDNYVLLYLSNTELRNDTIND